MARYVLCVLWGVVLVVMCHVYAVCTCEYCNWSSAYMCLEFIMAGNSEELVCGLLWNFFFKISCTMNMSSLMNVSFSFFLFSIPAYSIPLPLAFKSKCMVACGHRSAWAVRLFVAYIITVYVARGRGGAVPDRRFMGGVV